MDKIEKVKEILRQNNQESVIKILEKINLPEREKLAEQILNTDFTQILALLENTNDKHRANIEPIGYIDKNKLDENEKDKFSKIGEEVIKNNQYAVVTMAGGQGTRLGFKGPKGAFKLDIGKNGKYIFEILVDTLKRSKEKYETEVYWYIMTSVENNKATVDFFEENNYFGYNKEKVKFFIQTVLPLISIDDKNLLIDKEYNIKKASDGNGSIFKSLESTGMLEDMKEKGIKWVYVCGVDNIMANMVDTVFLGLTIDNNCPSASKSVKKSYPEEKVGVFCKKDGKPAVQEYIEMSEEDIHAKSQDGELLYGESNIVSHLFNIESIEKLSRVKLKYHRAEKKNSYINENLEEINPEVPNSYKFEAFIFDGFEYLDDMLVLRVNREEEFAPIKNAEGVDSPETAKVIYEENKRRERENG